MMRPAKPALRSASAKDPPIRPTPKIATVSIAPYTDRPTAAAIMRNWSINSANCCGNSDCAPSLSAWSGS